MTDKKFTDEEIIKRLNELSLYTGFQEKHIQVLNAALDLINRQKSEIERLQKEVNLVSILFQDLQERTDEIKAEAYREFSNQIKMHKRRMRCFDLCYEFWDYAVSVEDIDNILKEMVGE